MHVIFAYRTAQMFQKNASYLVILSERAPDHAGRLQGGAHSVKTRGQIFSMSFGKGNPLNVKSEPQKKERNKEGDVRSQTKTRQLPALLTPPVLVSTR